MNRQPSAQDPLRTPKDGLRSDRPQVFELDLAAMKLVAGGPGNSFIKFDRIASDR